MLNGPSKMYPSYIGFIRMDVIDDNRLSRTSGTRPDIHRMLAPPCRPPPSYPLLQVIAGPVNLAGHVVGGFELIGYKTPHDPIHNLLFSALSTLMVGGFLYCLLHVFHDKYFGFFVSGVYVFLGLLVGVVTGPVDDKIVGV